VDKIKPACAEALAGRSEEIEEEFIREASEKTGVTKVFNLITFIERETSLTKRTIFKILEGSKNLNLLFLNPQKYAGKVVEIIKEVKKSFEVKNISYINLEENCDVGILRVEMPSYGNCVLKVRKINLWRDN
jgi:type III restriction enzyme